jgi:membrane-associated phospholipid phosphatase
VAPSIKRPLLAAIACLIGLAALAVVAYGDHSAQVLDARVLAEFVAVPGSGKESAAETVRLFGNLPEMIAMLVLACAIGLGRRRPRSAAAALAVVAGANVTTQMLKLLFSHPRIQAALGADQFAWDGFPSGHVTAVMSIAIAFAFVVPSRVRPIVAILGTWLVVTMAWAVLVLNMHYPSDAIGGVLVGAAWGFAVLAGLRSVEAGYRPTRQPSRPAAISLK